ncbi:MAG: heavy metal sensor histidine kinase [Hydrogenophaga sp.]|jgi:two-component system heavy metal sensor histidine kinase CusS|uniref:heavy metal sensor histidine kinase n=1 Tax=Hydrogenophaga sp. TaxID=1904254 RepID=UPI0025B935F5|nr:heavy metal sensor histidine kinase [Hydrogenophaga sp.]MBW0184947.1 heavy metal sensor histidine kinase [Hydrogenophaga sp.]
MSLTVRLTILFACVLAVVLAGFSWLVFRETSSRFHELDELLLQGKVQLVAEAARNSRTEDELRGWLATSMPGHAGLYIKVLSDTGDLFEHRDLQLPAGLAEEFANAGEVKDWRRTAHSFHAKRFEVSLGGDGLRKLSAIAAVDTRQHTDFLDVLSMKTLGYVCFAVIVGTMLGWLASRGGLQPLTTMRARAEQINANRLSERISAQSWPKEMRELANSLNGLLDRLQSDFDRLSAFSANLAHEMRTPVSNLLTVAQVTLAQSRTSDEYRSTIETISEELQDQARTISDMLFLARTENMHALPSVQLVELDVESQSLVDFYDVTASEKALSFAVKGSAFVQGDRLMIRRAISNLLSNAVKYARPASTIDISISTAEGKASLAITNRGEEIPVASQASLFDRFVRLSSPSVKDAGGLGLGLAITKAIMRAHHGQVKLRSLAGANTFVLEFEKVMSPSH